MDLILIFKELLFPLTQLIVIIVAFVIGLYQYQRQQKFKRLQNLSTLWKGFSDNDHLLSLFDLMNEIKSDNNEGLERLKNYDRKVKLKYLALIEEVSLYVDAFEVDKDYANYLLQWHFYFPYQSELTSAAFWENLDGKEEMNAGYWKKSRDFSAQCKPV